MPPFFNYLHKAQGDIQIELVFSLFLPFCLCQLCLEEHQLVQKSLVQLEQSFAYDETNVTSEENLTNPDFADENKAWNLNLTGCNR